MSPGNRDIDDEIAEQLIQKFIEQDWRRNASRD